VRVMLKHGERGRRAGRGSVEDGGVLPFYRGRGGRRPVVKAEESPALMGKKQLALHW
jgi:hypothetical protein